jgi:hypothetical protein
VSHWLAHSCSRVFWLASTATPSTRLRLLDHSGRFESLEYSIKHLRAQHNA